MNCNELLDYFLSLQAAGHDLENIPIMYIEEEEDKTVSRLSEKAMIQVAYQTTKDEITLINTETTEEPIAKTQFKFALLIGRVNKID